jgi:hypothetical protein
MSKIKSKRILKAKPQKPFITYKRTTIRLSVYCPAEHFQDRRELDENWKEVEKQNPAN